MKSILKTLLIKKHIEFAKMKKTVITYFLLLLVAGARADNYNGSCGDNVYFTYNVSTHSLRVFGSGKMSENYYKNMPWDSYKADIQTVSIETGVTYIGRYTFESCSNIITASISNTVASIDKSAFAGCTSLASIDLPNSLISIGGNAFQGCQSLTSLVIPKYLTNIGTGAFSGCSGLISITVEDGNVKYDSRDNCNAIIIKNTNSLLFGCKNTIIPNSVITIADNAFSGCSELSSINIPSSITSIGGYAFSGCSSLGSISIPNSVISLGTYAFSGCSDLISASISNNVSEIKRGTFSGCKSLTSVTIPSSITNIGQEAFSHCSNLAFITIPTSVTIIGNNAFYGCGLKSISIPNSVTYIGESALANCKSLSNVEIPSSISVISKGTFQGCTSLSSIIIPNSVISIGETAFNGCNSLTSIIIPNQVVSIGGNAFSLCSNLSSVTISNNVKSIGKAAFAWCENLTSIEIPYGVTTIENGIFSKCSKLTSISLPNSVISIEGGAFEECGNLSNFEIPKNLESIGNSSFVGCSSLTEFVFPSSMKSIGAGAFAGTSLSSIEIPNSVYYIGGGAFSYCDKLSYAKIGNGIKIIESSLFCGSGLTNVDLGEKVDSIKDCAFQWCKLSSVNIPNSVKYIGDQAFYLCTNLNTLIIGSGITEIDGYAFLGLTNLKDVYCHSNGVPLTSQVAFYHTPIENATLHVPASVVPSFQTNAPWSGFKEIVAINGDVPDPSGNENHNTLCGSNLYVIPGAKVTLPIELTNEDEVKLCQFDLSLPAGVTVATKSNGKLDAKLTERAETHSISSQQLSNGNYRFIISSMDNDSFTGNSGTLVEITLDIPATMEAGEYTIKLLNAELSVPDGNDLKVVKPADTESKLTIKAYTSGDVNNDGSVSVTDVGCAINYILEQVPSVFIFEAADMNGDKNISVTDVGMIINLILNEGAASPQLNRAAAADANLAMLSTADGYQLQLGNKDAFIGFQMDVQVANGAAINVMKLMGGDDHLMTYRQLDNGSYRVVCYSPTNSTFVASDPALLNIATDDNVTISNVRLTTADLREVCLDAVSGGTTGITDVKGLQSEELKVYSLDGRLCRTIRVQQGENPLSGLKAGVYMIGNRKVVVR